jgi:hypothetical protein
MHRVEADVLSNKQASGNRSATPPAATAISEDDGFGDATVIIVVAGFRVIVTHCCCSCRSYFGFDRNIKLTMMNKDTIVRLFGENGTNRRATEGAQIIPNPKKYCDNTPTEIGPPS